MTTNVTTFRPIVVVIVVERVKTRLLTTNVTTFRPIVVVKVVKQAKKQPLTTNVTTLRPIVVKKVVERAKTRPLTTNVTTLRPIVVAKVVEAQVPNKPHAGASMLRRRVPQKSEREHTKRPSRQVRRPRYFRTLSGSHKAQTEVVN